jgi:uncharacterized protein YbjT (DUF2867 family)
MQRATLKSRILVTGGTGTLGHHVVSRLRDEGYVVRVLSRRTHEAADGIEYVTGDLLKDEGIQAAVDGAGIIVHCAGGRKGDDEATRNLVRAASRAGAQHLVYISVIGVDRIPVVSGVDRTMFGYFGSKLGAERVVADSGLPWTTLRAAQFYDLVLKVAHQMAKLPVIPVAAGFRFQPVDAGEVAARLVELALGTPAGLAPDMAGPRVYGMADLLRGYLRARGKHRLMVPVRLPGKAARAIRAGVNLAPKRAVGSRTWEDLRSPSAKPERRVSVGDVAEPATWESRSFIRGAPPGRNDERASLPSRPSKPRSAAFQARRMLLGAARPCHVEMSA